MSIENPSSIKEHWYVKNALKFLGIMVVLGLAIGLANEIAELSYKN